MQHTIKAERPTILFIHGAGVDHHWWTPQIEALQDAFNILAPDLPGHGVYSGEPFRSDSAIRQLAEALDTPGAAPVLAVGISLGGYLAIRLAGLHPEKISGLLLSGSSMNLNGLTGLQFKIVGAFLRLRGAEWITKMTLASYRKRIDTGLLARALPNGMFSEAAIQSFGQISGHDYHRDLAKIQSPVLLLNGAQDEANTAHQEALADRIPHGLANTLPGAGHLANLEKPEDFTGEIRRFAKIAFPSLR